MTPPDIRGATGPWGEVAGKNPSTSRARGSLLLVLQPCRQAGGVPAAPAHLLDVSVELVDQGGERQSGAFGPGLVEHQAEVLAHPVDREAEVELALDHGRPAVVHLPGLGGALADRFID